MKAPRPVLIIAVMLLLALYALGSEPIGTGPRAIGYVVGAMVGPAVVAALYVWWYRRRNASR